MDIKLNYAEAGSGAPLILLHGNGESHEYFIHQLEYFSKNRRVIALDTRGHGKSPRGEAPFTIEQFAEDLRMFMDEMNIPKADILGFSDGGNIALTFALKYPNRVNKLVLNGANLNPKGLKLGVRLPIEIGYRIAKLFAKKSPKAQRKAELLGLMVNEPNIAPERLNALELDVLVIIGHRDMIKDTHSLQILFNIPNSQLAVISGDHFIAQKSYKAFNEAVERFLK